MNRFKKFMAAVMALVLAMSAFSGCINGEVSEVTEVAPTQIQETAAPETTAPPTVSAGYYQVGDRMEDFTVTTYDGREVSLYQILEEKDMVLLNLWATWCGPCSYEFPAMQQAYEQYQDKVEILALSIEPTDSDEVLADYVQERGMSFAVARDTVGMESRFYVGGIPTSVVVDRFGTICLIETGAVTDPAVFTGLFEHYTAEDYTQSLFLPSMHAQKPDVQPADPAALNEALNGEGGTLVFTNSSNEFHWPMLVEQKDGRTVAVASNSESLYSKAVLETQVDVKAGDVLVMEFKLENNMDSNLMSVEVDGNAVKKCAIDRDWGTYAYSFAEAGSHQVRVCFDIDWVDADNPSNLWIDSIRVVSGDEAARALEANPKYPVGETTDIRILNENVRKGYVYDAAEPDLKDPMYFCDDPTIRLLITLEETLDPENTFLEDGGYTMHSVAPFAAEDGFVMELPNVDSMDMLGGGTLYSEEIPYAFVTIFRSEEHIDQYLNMLNEMAGMSIQWGYWDESLETTEVSGDVTYTVTYVDQNGDPVPGVMCQVCDETMCQVFTSDANGVCRFTLPAKNYEIHTLKVPAGYEGDTATVTKAPMQGGELTFTLTKK